MNLTTFTDADLHDLSAQIASEWERRRAAPIVEQSLTETIGALQDAGKLTRPPAAEPTVTDPAEAPAWQDPDTDHSAMYRFGDVVSHQGRTWRSTTRNLNSWEPGAPGVYSNVWLDVTPPPIDEETGEPKIIAWDTGQEVQPGDLRTHDGQTWECLVAHTTHEGWPPGPATHAVWKPAQPTAP